MGTLAKENIFVKRFWMCLAEKRDAVPDFEKITETAPKIEGYSCTAEDERESRAQKQRNDVSLIEILRHVLPDDFILLIEHRQVPISHLRRDLVAHM